ncbi:MAG TPA: hypothetical protein VHZ95_11555 [Polyangiales bacterium]|jgi:hypothetical protein|nr:hypothetical protein [Polyangiales bacterium]
MKSSFSIQLLALLAFLTTSAILSNQAHAQLRRPDRHELYNVELEPHAVWQWNDQPFWDDDGIGLGFRASIPLIDNGPIRSINNNLAIGFGLDWVYYGHCGRYNDDCDASSFSIPIVMQWNFFLTPWISIFPELGLAFNHASVGWDGDVPADCGRVDGINVCRDGASRTYVEPVFWFGVRFTLARNIAVILRAGTPSLTAGVSFLL